MTGVADLVALLSAGPVPGLRGSADVWRLDGLASKTEALRRALLSLAAGFPAVFVHYDGEQPREPSLASAQAVAPRVWRVPSGASGTDLSTWLYMGNWQLYARAAPLTRIPDLSRSDDAGVRRFVQEANVRFVIDSFHDDAQWIIAVRADVAHAGGR
jgi:hypothetical protein